MRFFVTSEIKDWFTNTSVCAWLTVKKRKLLRRVMCLWNSRRIRFDQKRTSLQICSCWDELYKHIETEFPKTAPTNHNAFNQQEYNHSIKYWQNRKRPLPRIESIDIRRQNDI